MTEDRGDSHVRIAMVGAFIAAIFLAIAIKAGFNTLGGPSGRPGTVPGETAKAQRADIVDRNGELLAGSIVVYTLYADPRAIWDADGVARSLSRVFPDLDTEAVAVRISDRTKGEVYIRRGLTPLERQTIFEMGLEGVGFREERSRIYPRGTLAGHVLGFANLDNKGLAGIEYAMDERLKAGGEPLRLTLDSAVQFAVETELSAAAAEFNIKGGVGIVLDAGTGDVLAMASWPPIDPNRYAELPREDPARLNRAVGAVYELGSVYKPLTVAAGLETGALSLGDLFDTAAPMVVAGKPITDTHAGHPRTSVTDIIVESSNKGTAMIGLRVGARQLEDFFDALGLTSRASIELAGSEAPLLPENWGELNLSRVSYGHAISVSPLAFAVAFSALANAGEIVEPRLVIDPTVKRAAPRRVMSAPTAAVVTQMMRENVIRGTGERAEVAGYRVAGKTGTAEKPIAGGYDPNSNISSFAALFPSDDPKFVVLVVLDDPESGPVVGEVASLNAAPTVGRIIERIAPVLGVEPKFDEPEYDPVSARARSRRETSL